MASKTTKKASAAAAKASRAPVPKDDGTRWRVVRSGRPVYLSLGEGMTRAQAEHLRNGLLEPAEIIQISTPS